MAAPTQEYPPWLSVSSSILTDANGVPTATATTVLNLPLTYYGPPIPLGTDGAWVYGGLTSPAPQTSSTPATTSFASTSLISTATPTTSATPSISTIPSSLSSSSSATLSTPSTSSSTTLASTSSPAPSHGKSNPGARLAAPIVGSILGTMLIAGIVVYCIYRRRKQGPRRIFRPRRDTPLWMWERVGVEDQAGSPSDIRNLGEGSPRGSGEEHDTFLRRSGSATDGMKEADSSARLVGSSNAVPADQALPLAMEKSTSGTEYASAESGNANSGATNPPHQGHIIPRDVLARMYSDPPQSPRGPQSLQSPQSPGSPDADDGDYEVDAPLLPPRLIDPDGTGASRQTSRKPSDLSAHTDRSMTPGNEPERATVQTARRVRMEDFNAPVHTISSSDDEGPSNESLASRWARAVGLSSFGNLGRQSWFNRASGTPPSSSRRGSRGDSRSRPTSFVSRPFNDDDLEAARSPRVTPAEMGYVDPRPLSTVSAKSAASGTTVFFDAQSRPPTPGGAQTGTASTGHGPSPLSNVSGPLEEHAPPAYTARVSPIQPPPQALTTNEPADILDLPVPRPASPFATASTATAYTRPTIPPGLVMPDPEAWRNSAGSGSGTSGSAGINIDVLEEAPPAAGMSWSMMRRSGPDPERRTTFGAPPPVLVASRENVHSSSEQGSMHSRLTPHSHLQGSSSGFSSTHGSGSSRQASHSQDHSGSSGLSHLGSITSDGRRRNATISPPLSAVGHPPVATVLPVYMPTDAPAPSPEPTPAPAQRTTVRIVAVPSTTVTSTSTAQTDQTRSSVTTHTSFTDPVTGEILRFPHVPSTAGHEAPKEDDGSSAGWSGSWGSPDHLRAMQRRSGGSEYTSHS